MANWITVRRSDGHDVDINLDMCSHIARSPDTVRVGTPTTTILLKGDEAADFEVKRSRALQAELITTRRPLFAAQPPAAAAA